MGWCPTNKMETDAGRKRFTERSIAGPGCGGPEPGGAGQLPERLAAGQVCSADRQLERPDCQADPGAGDAAERIMIATGIIDVPACSTTIFPNPRAGVHLQKWPCTVRCCGTARYKNGRSLYRLSPGTLQTDRWRQVGHRVVVLVDRLDEGYEPSTTGVGFVDALVNAAILLKTHCPDAAAG